MAGVGGETSSTRRCSVPKSTADEAWMWLIEPL